MTISIGRGLPSDTDYLKETDWLTFQDSTANLLRSVGTLCSETTGHGTWTDDTGRTYHEACATFVALDVSTDSLPTVRQWLRDLARFYCQDSIALNVHDSELIAP